MKGLGVGSRTPTFLNSGIGDWGDSTRAPQVMRGSPGSCIVLLGPVFHLGQSPTLQILGSGDAKFKVYKVRFKLPIS